MNLIIVGLVDQSTTTWVDSTSRLAWSTRQMYFQDVICQQVDPH